MGGTKIDQNKTKIQAFSILLNILVLPIGYSLTCLILHEATILCSSVFLSLKFPSSFSRFLEEDLITTLQDFVLKCKMAFPHELICKCGFFLNFNSSFSSTKLN